MMGAAQIILRPVTESDYPRFFAILQGDEVALRMAAFGTRDADATALAARWRSAFAEPGAQSRTVVEEGIVVGFTALFHRDGNAEVMYGIARSHWGRGIATSALAAFLREIPERPLHASAAADNAGSIRVLVKCGFSHCGSGRAFANARGEEIDESFFVLR